MSRGQTWGENEVLSLIEVFWSENIQSMVDNTSRNRDVYKIVTDLMERKGHCRNAYEIRTKVNNLKQWYKRVKTNQKHERHKRTRIYQYMQERLTDVNEAEDETVAKEDAPDEMEEDETHVEDEGEASNGRILKEWLGLDPISNFLSKQKSDTMSVITLEKVFFPI